MAKETSKALRRRWQESAFPWKKIFTGKGIDVGAGDDPLPFEGCIPFDWEQGDANKLSTYFPANAFDYLHASQVLEHMHDPFAAIEDWTKIVKLGGHLVITVPEMSLYGDILWGEHGSRYNPDHKSTYSFGLKRSGAPIHVYVPDFIDRITAELPLVGLLARVVDANYDYKIGFTKDQTWLECDGIEAWVELVLRVK